MESRKSNKQDKRKVRKRVIPVFDNRGYLNAFIDAVSEIVVENAQLQRIGRHIRKK